MAAEHPEASLSLFCRPIGQQDNVAPVPLSPNRNRAKTEAFNPDQNITSSLFLI
jgi:hypothetical protein